MCPGHHRLIHEGVLGVELRGGQPRFIHLGTQRELVEVPPRPCPKTEPDTAGPELGPEVNMPQWDGSPMSLVDTLGWMLLAHQAPSTDES